jgi:hypothetical protein
MDEGGLGLRSLISINEAANLKLCWEFLNANEDWAQILKSRVLRGQKAINHHILSSLWRVVLNLKCQSSRRTLVGKLAQVKVLIFGMMLGVVFH